MGSRPQSIPRRPAQSAAPFEELRREGVRRVQGLSGSHWTDYNLHDPGITILEQLCFGLTDLMFRADFSVPDHLTEEDGRLRLEHQALHRPETVFPCRPSTADDYRRLVLDRVPQVVNIWLRPDPGHPPDSPQGPVTPSGIYQVWVHLEDGCDPREVTRRVLGVLHAHRNIGEDFDLQVRIMEEERCELRARIEIGGGREPEEIMAEVYARVDRHISGDLDLDAPRPGDRSLEANLTGPASTRGVRTGGLVADRSQVHMADLVSLTRSVEGVRGVFELSLVMAGKEHRGSVVRVNAQDRVLCLTVPGEGTTSFGVRLEKGGRPVTVFPSHVVRKYRERSDAHRLGALDRVDPRTLYLEPTGVNRDEARYHSVQAHFPGVYGINEQGIPDSASPAVRAKAAQLKAYLLPMEQLLADQQTNIRHLRDLFSTADSDLPTYRYQVLGDREVPEVTPLYRSPPESMLSEIYGEVNRSVERRSRALDYMLAVYGESFNQHSLRQFDHYAAGEMEETIVSNKVEYLRSVLSLGRDRGGAFDHTRPSWGRDRGEPGGGNRSGLHRRVGELLGFLDPGQRSLVEPLSYRGLTVELPSVEVRGEGISPVPMGEGSRPIRPTTSAPDPSGYDADPTDRRREPWGWIRSPLGPEEGRFGHGLFTRGVRLENYRVAPQGEGQVLVFRPTEEGEWYPLGEFATEEDAVAAAHLLRNELRELNHASEGFHVLEHILLRPDGGGAVHPGAREEWGKTLWKDFYPLRASFLFSGWSARSSDPRFRLLAEETVAVNCPVHIHPTCFWLDFPQMTEFEARYLQWLKIRSDPEATPVGRDEAATPLIRFLQDLSSRADTRPPSP